MKLINSLILILCFCFSFYKSHAQFYEEGVALAIKINDTTKFIAKNNPADEPYKKEMYKRFLETNTSFSNAIKTNSLYERLPNSNTHSILEIKAFAEKKYDFGITNYAKTYCMKIAKMTLNEMGDLIRLFEDIFFYKGMQYPEYPPYNFFESCLCTTQAVGDVHVPPLFLVGEVPCSRLGFLARVHKYCVEKRKDPEKWLQIINAKNTNGETILDFLYTLEAHGNYNTTETQMCLKEMVKFICEHGGVHAFGKGTKDDYHERLKTW